METAQKVFPFFFSLSCCICYVYYTNPQNVYTLTQPRYNSSRTSSFYLCDSHEQYFCVCAIGPRISKQ